MDLNNVIRFERAVTKLSYMRSILDKNIAGISL